MFAQYTKKFNFAKGRLGEKIAKEFLEDRGYVLIEANYKNVLGEIDLIMQKEDKLVFVEVKLKVSDGLGSPEEMISKAKLARVQRIAEGYWVINRKRFGQTKTRIEAVCIVLNKDESIQRISHYDSF